MPLNNDSHTSGGKSAVAPRRQPVPELISIVIKEGARLHAAGGLTSTAFAGKLARLEKEELAPRGLTLTMRPLADGAMRFLIKSGNSVCEMIEYSPN